MLCRPASDSVEVALVQRPRYGDEWSLPKGKLERGETFEQAAVREIEEETGCEAEIVGFVGAVDYFVKKSPKVVLFYRMEVTKEPPFKPNDEVSRLAWLSPPEALERLDHELERKILRKFADGQR